MAKVTISGHPGSGTTTLVSILEEEFRWKSINGGQIFRNAAKNKNLSLVDFAELCLIDDRVDKELDEELMEIIANSDGPEIVESRLAGHWASKKSVDCKRVWLNVDEKVRAERVQKREGGDLSQVLFSIQQRAEQDYLRFQQFYQISLDDMGPYSLVINSNNLTPGEVADKVIKHLECEVIE